MTVSKGFWEVTRLFFKDFLKFVGIGLVIVATFVVWLQWLVGEVNQCGNGMVSIAQMGQGIMCVQAYKWQPPS